MSEKSKIDGKKERVVKLDQKDRKILYLLSEDAKLPVTEIAKEVGLSKDAVSYRIKRLVERGVIMYFIPVIDVQKLGFSGYYLYMRLQNLEERTDLEILNYLKQSKYTMFVCSCFGSYDVVVQLLVRNIQDVDVFLREFRREYDKYVLDFTLLITSREYKLPAKYLVESEGFGIKAKSGKKTEAEVCLDKKDVLMLKMLAADAKMPTYEIANELGISSDTVIYRIKKLVSCGVIEKFVAVVDVSKIGYRWHVVLLQLKNLTEEREKALLTFVKSHPNMLYVTRAIGSYDMTIDVNAKSEKHFNDILMEIRVKFHDIIKTYDSILMFEEFKYTYFPEVLWDVV